MIVHFDPRTGHITSEGQNSLKGMTIEMPLEDARAGWLAGDIKDCNIAFHRLATEYDFDVEACLEFYRQSG